MIWYRYVDDVLCLWPCTEDLDAFLQSLNNLVPSINFTIELENYNKSPFLDCLVHREGNGLKFSIYRKPTNVFSYIHHYSAHQDKI